MIILIFFKFICTLIKKISNKYNKLEKKHSLSVSIEINQMKKKIKLYIVQAIEFILKRVK